MNKAFSLVELSIVLVILGLLTGGILAGQSLIRASELRNVTGENQRFITAVQAFRDKYFGLPGDITNATLVWGKDATYCNAHTGTATAGTGTCNGDGDGTINENGVGGASTTAESFQLWRQLANAGLMEGTYTGIAGTGGGAEAIPGTNVPRSKLGQAGWSARWLTGTYGGNANAYAGTYGNYLQFGGFVAAATTSAAVLKPEEAWNIDTKYDDGKSGTGRLIARDLVGFNLANGCTSSTSGTDYVNSYNLSNSTVTCSLYFLRQW